MMKLPEHSTSPKTHQSSPNQVGRMKRPMHRKRTSPQPVGTGHFHRCECGTPVNLDKPHHKCSNLVVCDRCWRIDHDWRHSPYNPDVARKAWRLEEAADATRISR